MLEAPAVEERSPSPPTGLDRRIVVGLPLLAGALVLALGSAYFLQKDRYQRAAFRTETRLAAQTLAESMGRELDAARIASHLAGAIIAQGGAKAGGRPTASSLGEALPAVDGLFWVDADGLRHRIDADGATTPAERAQSAPVMIGDPVLRVEDGRLEYVQTLHVGGAFFGETVARSRIGSAQTAVAQSAGDALRWGLFRRHGDRPFPLAGVTPGPDAIAVPLHGDDGTLELRAEPLGGWPGNPFLPVELALCLTAAILSATFGILVLRQPARRPPHPASDARTISLHLVERTLDAFPVPASLQDARGRYVVVNAAFERLTGHDRETLRRWGEIAAQPGDVFELLAQSSPPASAEVIGADGRSHPVTLRRHPFGDDSSLSGLTLTTLGDRSDLQDASRRVGRLTRNLAVVSGISEAIVHHHDASSLLARSCELLVERGEFPLAFAWQRGPNGLSVANACGAGRELAQRILDRLTSCPTDCKAFQGSMFLCVKDDCRNPEIFSAIRDTGIRSLTLLPLAPERQTGIGLASREPNAFTPSETELLREMSATLSHALTTIGMECSRREAEEHLRLASRVFENSSEGIIITDPANRILMVNRTFTEVTGYAAEEVIGRNPRLLSSGEQSAEFYRGMWDSIQRRGEWHGEVQNRRKNGEYYSEWLTISVVTNGAGEITNYVAVFSDITSKKQIAERLDFLANYDPLTTLPNRVLFTDRLEQALTAARAGHRQVAVIALDLDRFSLVNETFGHAAGDRLLKEIAARLCASVREGDSVSRVGGDEFSIILADLQSPDEATLVAGKIMQALATPLVDDGRELFASASIGIGVFPDDGENADALVRNANSAMYRAMEEGRNTFRFYHQQMNARSSERMSLQTDLRRALERGELVMHYQPFIDARSGRIVGAEALLRWFRPGLGFVAPTAFIPLLEETGMIVPVGEWVLASACEDCQRWHGHGHHDFFVAVNFSALQLTDANSTRHVADTLSRLSANPRHLEIELTESAVMRDPAEGIRTLNGFREIGTRLSIDDFGTGYSSLAYIKKLPIDTLKIDRSFVVDTPDETEANAIVQAIIAMGHNLDLKIIAEGVQERNQVDFLRQTRCDLLQGFYFSAALPQQEFLSLAAADSLADSPWQREPWAELPPVRLSRI